MYIYMTVYTSAYIYVYMSIYVYICMHVCMYIYGWSHLSHNYAFFVFKNILSEKFQQCTKMRHSNVYTSASTIFFTFTLLYLQCLLVNVLSD